MSSRQVTPVMCPVCGARFMAPIDSIIDVGRVPQLKSQLLQGRLNTIQCPQCGRQSAMNAPLFYHDPAHQLALVLMPQELNIHHNEQQKIIGDLTNAVMNSLPAEQRKGYLLTPQIFFTMQSLVNAILQADGITPEMIERQRGKARLLEQLLQANSEEALRALVTENEAQLDIEFFQILMASAQAAQNNGQPELARALLGMRTLLAQWSSSARAAINQVNAAMGLGEILTREELLERLQAEQSEEEWQALVAAARPLLDYAFFQDLTAKIEAAPDPETAQRLKGLRSRILDTTAQQDEAARQGLKNASDLLRAILQASDPEAVIRQRLAEIDDFFFAVLSANLQRAQSDGRGDWVERLEQIGEMVMTLLEEQLPPEVRLINQLMLAPYPDGTRALLTQNQGQITSRLLTMLEGMAGELEASGQPAAAEHLRQVLAQARTLLEAQPQTVLRP